MDLKEFLPIVANVILLCSVFPPKRRDLHIVAAIGCVIMLGYGFIVGSLGLIIGQTLSILAQAYNIRRFWKESKDPITVLNNMGVALERQ